MAQLKMSGRIYNAMMKFAKGTKSAPQLAEMFFDHGKVYATDSYAICRWIPAEETTNLMCGEEVYDKFYFSAKDKVAAGSTIYFDSATLDINTKSNFVKNVDSLFTDYSLEKNLDKVVGINSDYIAAVAALGKAVRADKCGANGTVDMSWAGGVFNAHIAAGKNGYFDIVVMPMVNRK